MTALNKLKVFIDYKNGQQQYKLEKSDIQLKSYKQFQKQKAQVYTLVDINYLISLGISSLINKLPENLKKNYPDVFSDQNAKKLAPHQDIDLAIELQPGKEPLYSSIYPLLPQELATLKEQLKENLRKGFI